MKTENCTNIQQIKNLLLNPIPPSVNAGVYFDLWLIEEIGYTPHVQQLVGQKDPHPI